MTPITFIFDTKGYFKEFKAEDGAWVYQRNILATPFGSKFGAGITFEIMEAKCVNDGRNKIDSIYESKIDLRAGREFDSPSDKALLEGLYVGDLRGLYAEEAVWALYYNYFVKTDEGREWLGKFLPDLLKHWDDFEEMAREQKEKEQKDT